MNYAAYERPVTTGYRAEALVRFFLGLVVIVPLWLLWTVGYWTKAAAEAGFKFQQRTRMMLRRSNR